MSRLDPTMPERVVYEALCIGVEAIVDELRSPNTPNPGPYELDKILAYLDDDEKAKAREVWTANPPKVVPGFARDKDPFPLYAITLGGDDPNQEYIGVGNSIQDCLDEAEITGEAPTFVRRNQARFTIWCYAQHPDVVAWNYRVARRILNVAIPFLINRGLQEPQLSGADLMPEPKYTPDNLYVRRLTLTVEYNEAWTDQGPLWAALNGEAEPRITGTATVDIRHRYSDPFPGSVTPYVAED